VFRISFRFQLIVILSSFWCDIIFELVFTMVLNSKNLLIRFG